MRYIISILLLTLTPFIIHAQSIISSPDYGCDSIDVAFHYSDSANATNYNWDFDNGETSANAAEVVTFDTIGSFHIKLVVDGSLTFWDTIVVRPQPSAKFRYSDSMAIGSYAIEFFKPEPKDSLFNYTYSWIFRDGST